MTPKEQSAMQQALEALEGVDREFGSNHAEEQAITALREALAGVNMSPTEQAEQEPMKECRHCGFLCRPNSNESRKWYPLEQADRSKNNG